ncbi:hypothetical protein COCNU_14G001390 [Cocos nucifera]|uniref:Uncharacterized protein n=1 Tax=Cocos nucifera TaxID=13894 RepID=A0A8K0IU73_COCNU|nr:hypothetical protein COCNU_14G001390 [Cocos nucifera]
MLGYVFSRTAFPGCSLGHDLHKEMDRNLYKALEAEEKNLSGRGIGAKCFSEKLIDSRFLKKDEVVESGRTLTMEAHLVDIGDPEANHKPLTNLNISGIDKKLDEVADIQGQNGSYTVVSLSSDNKKNTLDSRLPQKHSVAIPSSAKVSKKTEFGSSGAPQTRPNTRHMPLKDGAVLNSKFLKSAENVEKGSKIELSKYLVEVCEPLTFLEEDLQKGHSEQVMGSSGSNIGKSTNCRRLLNDEQLRDASQILSILQKPLPKENADQRKLPVDQAHSSPSSDHSLLDVQSLTKELSVPWTNFVRESVGDKHDYDSSGGAAETSTSGSPFVDFEASQEVHTSSIIIAVDTDGEEKLPSDGMSGTGILDCYSMRHETIDQVREFEPSTFPISCDK